MIAETLDPHNDDLAAALATEELPVDDLAESGRCFFRFVESGRTVGFGGYELHGASVLLRSVVVRPEARGQGFGGAATEILLRRAADAGASHAYLLTTSAAPFFEAAGFAVISRDVAPAEILATRQAAALCPSTAALLMRPLSR